MMDASYYIPKMPMSVPMYNAEKKTFSVFYSDGMMADIPADLFYKMFYLKGEETEFDAMYGVDKQETVKEEQKAPPKTINEFIKENYSDEDLKKETEKACQEITSQIRVAKLIGWSFEEFFKQITEGRNMSDMMRDHIYGFTKSIWEKA